MIGRMAYWAHGVRTSVYYGGEGTAERGEQLLGMLRSFSDYTLVSREGKMELVSRYKLPSPASSTCVTQAPPPKVSTAFQA